MDAQIVIRLPVALKERCEQIAKREMMTVSSIARLALKARVEQDEASAEQESQSQTTEAGS